MNGNRPRMITNPPGINKNPPRRNGTNNTHVGRNNNPPQMRAALQRNERHPSLNRQPPSSNPPVPPPPLSFPAPCPSPRGGVGDRHLVNPERAKPSPKGAVQSIPVESGEHVQEFKVKWSRTKKFYTQRVKE